jgi:hypothetical protein
LMIRPNFRARIPSITWRLMLNSEPRIDTTEGFCR